MDTWLTQEELSAIFGAIHDAEMKRLRAERDRLLAWTAEAEKGMTDERRRLMECELRRMEKNREDRQGRDLE